MSHRHDSEHICLKCNRDANLTESHQKQGAALRRWWNATHGGDAAAAAAKEADAVAAGTFRLSLRAAWSSSSGGGVVSIPRTTRRAAPRRDKTVMAARRDEWRCTRIAPLPLRIVEIATSTFAKMRRRAGPTECGSEWGFTVDGLLNDVTSAVGSGSLRRPWRTAPLRYLEEAHFTVAVPRGSCVTSFALAVVVNGAREVRVVETDEDGARSGATLVPWASYGGVGSQGGNNMESRCYRSDVLLVETEATFFKVSVRHQVIQGKACAGLAVFSADGRPRKPPSR